MAIISVVVPVYNVEKYLNRCIDSILNQTFSDFELILVDDGSPDNCGKICDEYAIKDKRIHVIHKVNGGLSEARNYGIEWAVKKSNSSWITFIDSDDWVHPDFLKILYKAVLDNNTFLSFCTFKRMNSFQQYEEIKVSYSRIDTQRIFYNKRVNSIVAWGKLFKKKDFESVRFPVGRLHEDEFTTYKILFKYKDVSFVNNELYFYYVNPDSITQSSWNLRRLDNLDAFKQQIAFFKEKRLKKAYKRSIRALFSNIGIAIEKLREYYPTEKKLRYRLFLLYYSCRIRFWWRYLIKEEKQTIRRQIHPKLYR